MWRWQQPRRPGFQVSGWKEKPAPSNVPLSTTPAMSVMISTSLSVSPACCHASFSGQVVEERLGQPFHVGRAELLELLADLEPALVDGALHDLGGLFRAKLGAEFLVEGVVEQRPGLDRLGKFLAERFFAHGVPSRFISRLPACSGVHKRQAEQSRSYANGAEASLTRIKCERILSDAPAGHRSVHRRVPQ